ncbi:MAG: PorV/PorQ family protein [Bacteroidia bacterium]
MIRRVSTLVFLCSLAISSYAQAPKYSNEFLSIGVGARALGMSNSIVAAVDDATAGFWNPAGLVSMRGDLQVNLMHNEFFAGIGKYDYASLGIPIDSGRAIAFSFIRFGVDDIPDTSELIDADGNINYDKIKSFSVADYAFLFSYSKATAITGFRYGANAKIIHRKVGKFANAWGFGLDAGVQYDYNKWKFGAMGRDITSTFNAWNFTLPDELITTFANTGNEIPENSIESTLPKLILSAAYKTVIAEKFSILPVVDVDLTFDGKRNVLIKSDPISADPHIGMEIGYRDFIFLRGGIGNIQDVKDFDGTTSKIAQPNMGLGIKIKNVSIDYALTNLGQENNLLYSNVFSLRWEVYKKGR